MYLNIGMVRSSPAYVRIVLTPASTVTPRSKTMMTSYGMGTSCLGWLMPWIGMGAIVLFLTLLIYLIFKITK